MFFHGDIKGDRLARGTLCLTYDDGPAQVDSPDDGPGPRTLELAEYLADRGIRATFFVVGKFAAQHIEILDRMARLGHLLGNHTMTHPGLVAMAKGGGDVIRELAETDAILRKVTRRPLTYFRAPYGNWRESLGPERGDQPTSIVASAWNRSPLSRHCVGPINWDISGHDYDYWEKGEPAAECADEYLERIERFGRGVVLMHDSSEDAETRARNRTFEVTRMIVPLLRDRGYRFIGLDEIPQVRSAARVGRQVAFLGEDGRFLGVRADNRVIDTGTTIGPGEQFGIVELEDDRIALRASHGEYLSLRKGRGELIAAAPSIGPREIFRRLDLGSNRVVLQGLTGIPLPVGRPEPSEETGPQGVTTRGSYLELDLFRL